MLHPYIAGNARGLGEIRVKELEGAAAALKVSSSTPPKQRFQCTMAINEAQLEKPTFMSAKLSLCALKPGSCSQIDKQHLRVENDDRRLPDSKTVEWDMSVAVDLIEEAVAVWDISNVSYSQNLCFLGLQVAFAVELPGSGRCQLPSLSELCKG